MSVKDFVKAGFRFDYCIDCGVREIPSVQDVLYSLRLSDEDEYYVFSLANHATYVANVHLVASALSAGVPIPYDTQLVAQAILELCPEEAKCVEYPAYSELLRQAHLPVPKHDHATCPHCIERSRRDNAPTDDFDCEDDDVD